MRLTEASREITKRCKAIDGEICFDVDGPDIYWKGLRIRPAPDDMPKVIDALKMLIDLGIVD